MSSAYSYPGAPIQELPSPVHSITGVATSITAFVGYTARGIDNRAQAVFSFSDFERLYGGLASNSEVSYAVQQFFQNGGSQAYVVRTPMHYPTTGTPVPYAQVEIDKSGTNGITFTALSSGEWANSQLLIDVDVLGLDLSTTTGDPLAFNLTITNVMDNTTEYFPDVTLNSAAQNYFLSVISDPNNGSQLVKVSANLPTSPTALNVTGVLGAPLTIANVNTALGGGTAIANADCSITLTYPGAPSTVLTIKVIGNGAAIPQTVSGLASQLQTALNAWLMVNLAGASVTCVAAPSGSGTGIRVNALLPNQPDAMISFGDPATGNKTATALGLQTTTFSNVAHYALGTTTNNAGLGLLATPATAPSGLPQTNELIGDPLALTGIYALSKVDIFNLLSIPEAARALAGDPNSLDPNINPTAIYSAAVTLCDQKRAFLLIDPPPNVKTVAGRWIGRRAPWVWWMRTVRHSFRGCVCQTR